MDDKTKQDIALFRHAVLGALVGAELAHGDLVELCRQAAERRWEFPDGSVGALSARTIEGWYYAYKKGGLVALRPDDRRDLGASDIPPRACRPAPASQARAASALVAAADRHDGPGRPRPHLASCLARRCIACSRGTPSPDAPSAAPPRSAALSSTSTPASCSSATPCTRAARSSSQGAACASVYLLSAARLRHPATSPESFFAFHEDAPAQEKGLKQVLLAHGRWRRYYVDLGPAYVARSLRIICAELDMRLLHTGAGDASAKGAIEKWHRTWREEVEDELPDHPIALSELEAKHRRLARLLSTTRGSTTRRGVLPESTGSTSATTSDRSPRVWASTSSSSTAPRAPSARSAPCAGAAAVSKSAPTSTSTRVELRYDPTDPDKLPKVYVEGKFACDTVPLDLYRNAQRKRRRDLGAPDPKVEPTGIDPLADLVRDHQRLTSPLGYLADKETADDEDDEQAEG
jgi:hypothetical protein